MHSPSPTMQMYPRMPSNLPTIIQRPQTLTVRRPDRSSDPLVSALTSHDHALGLSLTPRRPRLGLSRFEILGIIELGKALHRAFMLLS